MVRFLNIIALAIMAPAFLWAEVWESIGLEGQEVTTLVVNPQDSEIMYAIAGFRDTLRRVKVDLLKTTDSGKTWCSILGGFQNPLSFAIDPRNPNNVYLSAFPDAHVSIGRVFKSTDGGETWDKGSTPAIDPGEDIRQIVVHPADPNVLYVVNRAGLAGVAINRSSDGGKTWTWLIADTGAGIFIDVDPRNPNLIYGAFMGLFRFAAAKNEGQGRNWTKLNLPGNPEVAWTLAVAPSRPDMIYVVSYRGDRFNPEYCIFKSPDGGSTWEVFPLSSFIRRLKVSPVNPNLLYGIESWPFAGKLHVSEDGGKNWRLFMDGMEEVKVFNLTFHPKRPWILYSCTDRGIYRMTGMSVGVSPGKMKKTIWGYIRKE